MLLDQLTAVINKQVTTSFTDYKKHLVQFDQQTKDTPDYLFFNIRGSGNHIHKSRRLSCFLWGERMDGCKFHQKFMIMQWKQACLNMMDGKMKMNMDLDLNGFLLINAREDYFHLKGYYKSSVNNQNVLFGNNVPYIKVPFGGYLIEVYVLITSAAVGNDYAFRLIIRGHEGYTRNTLI